MIEINKLKSRNCLIFSGSSLDYFGLFDEVIEKIYKLMLHIFLIYVILSWSEFLEKSLSYIINYIVLYRSQVILLTRFWKINYLIRSTIFYIHVNVNDVNK